MQAFETIKDRMTTAPVLALPRDKEKWLVETDTSNFAFGGVLTQEQPSRKYHPVAYLSKGMTLAKRNKEIYNKELGAIKLAFNTWQSYLLGAREPVTVHSGHKNLMYWRKPQRLNRQQAQWVSELQDYGFILEHKPGKSMGKLDAMS